MSIKVKVGGGRSIKAIPKQDSTTPIVAPAERKPQIVPDSVVLGIDTIGPYIQRIDAGPGIVVFPEDDIELANVVISHANTSTEISTNNDNLSFTRNVDIDVFGHVTKFYNTSLSSLNFSANGTLIQANDFTIGNTSLTIGESTSTLEGLSSISVDGESTFGSVIVDDLTPSRIVYVGASNQLRDSDNFTFDGSTFTTSNTFVVGTLDVSDQTTLSSVNVEDLTNGRVVLAGQSGELEDSANIVFDGTTLSITGLDVAGQVEVASLNVEDLTQGRIVHVGFDGELIDSANLTFDGVSLTATNGVLLSGLDVTGQGTFDSVNVEDLTPTRIVYAGVNGELIDSANLVFDGVSLTATGGVFLDGLEVQGQSTFGSANVEDLTQGRIVHVGIDGELIDSANLTFDGTTLTATNGVLLSGLDVTGQSTFDSVNVQDLTPTRIVYAGTDGELVDSANLYFDGVSLTATGGVFLDGLEVQGQSTFGSANIEDLTPTRIVFAGTNGELVDSANLTFDGVSLTATGGVFLDGLEVQGQSSFGSVNVEDLTSGRIVYAGTNGELIDSANLYFDGTNLTATGGVFLDGLEVQGQSTFSSVNVTDLTQNRVILAGPSGELTDDSRLRFSANTLTIEGNADIYGNLTLGGNLIIGDSPVDTVNVVADFTSDLIPGVTNTFDIGTVGKNWNRVFTPTLKSDTGVITIDTTGALTIPVGSTGDRPTPATGMLRYNSSDDRFEGYDGTNWAELAGSVKDVNKDTFIRAETAPGDNNDQLDFFNNGTQTLQLDSDGAFRYGNGLNKIVFEHATGNANVAGALGVEGQTTLSSVNVEDLTSGRVVLAGTNGELVDNGDFTFDGTTFTVNTDFVASDSTLATARVLDLVTSGIVTVGPGGRLRNSANLAWDGFTLTIVGGISVDGDFSTSGGLSGDSLSVGNLQANTMMFVSDTGALSSNNNIQFNGSHMVVNATSEFRTAPTFETVPEDSVFIAGANGQIQGSADLTFDGSTFNVNSQVTVDSLNVEDLTSGRVVLAGTSGEIEDSANLTFDGSTLSVTGDADVSGQGSFGSLNVEDLTNGRLVLAGTNGELEDSANLTFDGSTLEVGANVSISGSLTIGDGASFGGDQVTVPSLNVLDLTSGRVIFAGANGELEDSSSLTWDGTTFSVDGNADITGNLTLGGNITIGDQTLDTINVVADFTSDLIPKFDNTYDLGEGEVRNANGVLIDAGSNWRTIYVRNIGSDTGVVKVTANGAFTVPVGTTLDRPFPLEAGMVRFNSSDGVFEGYSGVAWASLGGVKDVDQDTYIQAESSPGADNDQLEFYTAGTRRFLISNTGSITTDTDTDLVLDLGGIFNVGNTIITGVDAPVNSYDAVNKDYLENTYARDFYVTKSANTYALDLLDETNPAKLELGDAISGVYDVANNKVTIGLDPVWDSFTGLREAGPEGTVPNFEFDEFGRVRSLINIPLSVSSNAVVDFANSIFDVVGDAVRNGNQEQGITVIPDFANLKLDFYVRSFDIDLEGAVSGSATVQNNSNTTITTTFDYPTLDARYLNVEGGDTANGDLGATRFIDKVDTDYYVHPTQTSRIRNLIVGYGYNESSIQMATGPTSYQYIYATATRIGYLSNNFNFGTYFDTINNSWRVTDGSVYSRNFIDSQNENYLLNPAGLNSRIAGLNVDAQIIIGSNLKIANNAISNSSGDITLSPTSGILDVDNSIISNVVDPVNSLDAVNKQYLEQELANTVSSFVGGDGITYNANNVTFSVNVDDSTIEIFSDVLRVKDAGITNAKLANPNITFAAESGSADAVALGETITFAAGEGINTTVSANQILIAGELASDTNVGVASFNINNFTVSGAGDVTVTTLDGGTF